MRRLTEGVPEEGGKVLGAGAAGGRGAAETAPHVAEREQRLRSLQWANRIGVGGLVAVVLFNVAAYVQTGAWQMLLVIASTAVSAVVLLVSSRLAARGRLEAARNVMLAAMVLMFATGELAHAGLTWYLGAGGVALILLIGLVLVPGKWWTWVVVAAAYAGYVVLVNWLRPLPRYDVRELGLQADAFMFALVGFLIVATLFLVASFYQRLVSIRVRLPVSFVLVVLGSVMVIASVGAVVGSQGGRRQASNQLESVARMKEAEIDQWIGRVERALDDALASGQLMPRMVMLLEERELTETEVFYPQNYLRYAAQDSDYFDDFALLTPDGEVRLFTAVSSDESEVVREEDLRKGMEGFHLQPLLYAAERYRAPMVAMRPILNDDGLAVGVLAGIVDTWSLSELLGERAWLGETGEMYLIDRNRRLLTDLRFSHLHRILLNTELEAAGVAGRTDVVMGYMDYRGEQVVGVAHWLPQLEVALVAKQDLAEAAAVTNQLLRVIALVSAGAFVVSVAVSLLLARSITEPLAVLTDTAGRIASGDLDLVPTLTQRDEVGTLSRAFGSMTTQLRELIGSLEERVSERTRELERRSAYLEASADVGRAASSILDPDQLMREVVELIRDRFDLYYVGLFLVGEERGPTGQRWAVLRAGTGWAGEQMLRRRHRIEVGKGLIGWSVAHAQWRVVEEAAEDAAGEQVRLATPELPETRSEAALPLRSRGQVLGAITVQHTEPAAFDSATLSVLQTMADQVAVAIDNAHLFDEGQRALEAERQAYGEVSRQAWMRLMATAVVKGYRCDDLGVAPASGELSWLSQQAVAERRAIVSHPAPHSDGGGNGGLAERHPGLSDSDGQHRKAEVVIPVMVRGQVLGVLRFGKEETDNAPWSREQLALAEGMAEQLGQALESARLYQDSQRRAAQEQLVGELTARMRATLDVDTVLQTAVQEMRQALGYAEVEVLLDAAEGSSDQG